MHDGNTTMYQHPDGNWYSSAIPAVVAAQRAETARITSLARQHNYSTFPDMGSNGGDGLGKSRGFTREQIQEWKNINSHRGHMGDDARARIIKRKQEQLDCSSEEFDETIEHIAEEFLDEAYASGPRNFVPFDDSVQEANHFGVVYGPRR
jgi:hypothetical protein